MDPVEALASLGGVASRTRLLERCTRGALARATASGDVDRVNRTDYALPDVDRASRVAVELRGKVGVLSAAVAHGWEVPRAPDRPWVVLDHRARAPVGRRAHVVWGDLGDESGLVTSERRTVLDCSRRLPFEVALCVADSALRGGLDPDDLRRDAAAVTGKGAARARLVAAHASGLAANVFESLLRSCAIEAGLDVEPQGAVEVGSPAGAEPARVVHPDLVDRGRRLAVEADSWEFHSGREAFQRDCWRYTVLVVNGWTVLRFTWWQVAHHREWVVACLRSAAARADRRATG